MACYKLTSCTSGNPTVIYTNTALTPGSIIEIFGYSGICFTVELSDAPCSCGTPNVTPVVIINPDCICNTPYTCYKLVDCLDPNSFFYSNTNLNAYVGTTIQVFEHPGHCWNVIGIANPIECENNLPITEPVTCAAPCTCTPVVFCYELTNCLNLQVITVNSTQILALNNVIEPIPAIIFPGGNNCWTVSSVNIQPCDSGTGTPLLGFTGHGVNGCAACAGPPRCYKLTNCDNTQTVYTQSNLLLFVGLVVTVPSLQPSACWLVSDTVDCIDPVPIDPGSIVLNCVCPCYELRNCLTQELIYSYTSTLINYVGQSVHLNEYGGCNGDCWLVAISPIPCQPASVEPANVALGCVSCPPCDQSCYELVDCETDVVFLTVYNPTVNNVNLTLLINGQAIGQINANGQITNGCWYVREAENCTTAVEASVFNIYQPTQTLTGCDLCLNSCYGLLNCKTLLYDYIIKYTGPNPNPLIPNPATITGSIGNLCFTPEEGGCVTGCFIFQLIPNVQCDDPIDWTEVVSYTTFQDCDDCLPKCYLLTECPPAVADPFIVSNDLSLYVGSVAKICDAQGNCKCYSVELAQTCDGAVILDNANASFTTCEECNSCDCPPGYTKIDDHCQKVTSVPATLNQSTYNSAPGSANILYGDLGTRFYANANSYPFPLTAVTTPDRFVDLGTNNVAYTSSTTGVWGGPVGSRLATVGIWTAPFPNPNPINEWIGFAKCIDIPVSGTYCVGIGGDDCIRVKLDGVVVANACIGYFDFQYWHVFELNLTAGTHVIVVEGKNVGGPAAFGAEIYQTTIANLQTITTVPALQAVTIFSTFPMRSTPTPFQTGETSGYSCPPGATLNLCGEPSCTIIETIPFVPCPPTYVVKDCTGTLPDFLTNTDLSAYVSLTGTSYKFCIPDITYSTTCFILKDCNRIVPDITTDTNLTPFLWQTVSLEGYPGSCFIVTGVPADQECLDPIPVVVLDPTQEPCPCEGAQQPWPAGCYCVTVEEVFPIVIAPNFEGVSDSQYDCCEACLQVCYLLTSCVPGINSVVVCNDLEDYVGKVIKIASCGDICWQVDIASSCAGSITFAGEITPFEDCKECLPPIPPIPPPYDLHLRKIKPGWKSPNKCYTLDYIEKINCTFGQQVYNKMLVSRYGITVCCDEDINKWDIKKQMLDLDMLKDPNLCKSTLCCCPAPCLIDAVITLLPFCGAPIIVSVDLDLPCPAPVLIGVDIEVEVIPALCYCWKVDYATEGPLTIAYIDCCCVVQTQILDVAGEGSVPICAATAPVSYNNDITGVTNMGLCSEADLCNPPPPQVCSCWRISNPNSTPGNWFVNTVCPCDPPFICVGTFGVLPPGSPDAYICSIPAPSVSAGLIATNMGPCGTYCGPTPPECVCYEITITSPADPCTFNYIDCDGLPAIFTPVTEISYVCAQTMPTSLCPILPGQPPPYTIASTPFACVDGHCGPPFPCDCHIVTVTSPDGQAQSIWYYDCNGVFQNPFLPDGVHYLCGSGFDSFSPYVVFQTTPADCSLGECIAPQACDCYYFDGVSAPSTLSYTDCLGGSQVQALLPGTIGYFCGSAPTAVPPINIVPAPGQCRAQGLPC